MNKKISEIKNEFAAASLEESRILCRDYQMDERAGVKKIIEKYQKDYIRYEQELARLEKMKEFEYKYADFQAICGIDEAGRGPLAGPVVAGAVILPKDASILYINDSKQLSEKKREELYDEIMQKAIAVGVGVVTAEIIDEINILQATYRAMQIAVEQLKIKPDILLNDAVHIPGISTKQVAIVKGDARSVSIAGASIIAKVTRDRMMREYDILYPEYRFASNKGYGSAEHMQALREYGASPIHRQSFIGNII